MTGKLQSAVMRQSEDAFVIPDESVVRIHKIEGERELERTFKVKNIGDVVAVARAMRDPGAWFMSIQAPGERAKIIAVSQAMHDAFQATGG